MIICNSFHGSNLSRKNIVNVICTHFVKVNNALKRNVEFRHSTFQSPELGGKWGTECLNTRFPSAYPAVCGIQREADFLTISKKVIGCTYL